MTILNFRDAVAKLLRAGKPDIQSGESGSQSASHPIRSVFAVQLMLFNLCCSTLWFNRWPWFMLATGRVYAGFPQPQPLHRFASHKVRVDDFIHIGGRNPAVPDRFRINHQVRTMLTLVQAARLVRPYSSLQSAFPQFLLKQFLQLRFPLRIAAPSRMTRRPLIPADENVLFELSHQNNVQDGGKRPALGR